MFRPLCIEPCNNYLLERFCATVTNGATIEVPQSQGPPSKGPAKNTLNTICSRTAPIILRPFLLIFTLTQNRSTL
jgi:hypothetical protein